jgi:endonuclease/exonuclease/phosphatase family metal-dependent hydrolase
MHDGHHNWDAGRQLRIWGQNLNKSLIAQNAFYHSLDANIYDLALLQEPHLDFRGLSRVKRSYTSVYPPAHATQNATTRSTIWVNTSIPSSRWQTIPMLSPDITAIDLYGDFGTLRVVNLYIDCEHNEALDVLAAYMASPSATRCPTPPLRYMWAGDFNRHHPSWDEIRNHHLFTAKNARLVQPLLDLLARYDMRMVLPKDIPTLRALSTGNLTRVDNVFCSPSLLGAYIKCDTDPGSRPPRTDHFPVIQVLDLAVVKHKPQPTRVYRKTDWEWYRESLQERLQLLPRPAVYDTVEDLEEGVRNLEEAVRATTEEVVPLSKPYPQSKRWFTPELKRLKQESAKLQRNAYHQRFKPEHPVHDMAKAAEKTYAKAIETEKARHWWEWLANLGQSNLWSAHKFINAQPSDGGTARIPTLEKRHPHSKQIIATADTNEDKANWLKAEFFPPPMEESLVPEGHQYPPPAWEWKPVTDEVMMAAVERMKPYKATYPGSEPNCVLRECADLLIPFAGPIFRAIDALGHYPNGWAELFILALRKPGKTNYADPAALRPIALSKGFA